MSRTKRIVGGAGIGYLHQALILLVGLWLTPFLLARVGHEEYGLWLVAGQLLGYLDLLDLGVLNILPREVAFASGQDGAKSDLIIGLIGRVRRIVRWQLPIVAAAGLLVWWFLPAAWSPLEWPLALVLAAFLLIYPLRISIAALQGIQELAFLATLRMIGWAIGTGVTVALVLAGMGLFAIVLGWIAALALPAGFAWRRARQLWPVSVSSARLPAAAQYFHRSMWVGVGQIGYVLLAGSDILLLGAMLGPAAVVTYACTGKLVTVFANHPQLLMHAAQPALSELRASASRERLASVATALTQTMLMLSGALIVGILIGNHYFVAWWVGSSEYGGAWLTLAFCGMMLLRNWNFATVYTLFCFGHERQLSLTSLADGLVTIVATLLGVWQWGPIGAPVGSILGVALVSLPVNLRALAHEMGLSPRSFLGGISSLFLRIVPVGAAAAVAATRLPEQSFTSVLALLVPVAALYATAVVPVAWQGPVGPYLRATFPMLDRRFGADRPMTEQRRAS
jgi:O-antigen/teichoic acid export membrane protein